MPTIHVCPLHLLRSEAQRLKPSRVLTLLSPRGSLPERPGHLAPDKHLLCLFDDIEHELPYHTAPSEADIASVIAFASAWEREAPLLIHCYAGISRSTAAALISALVVAPETDDAQLVQRLRRTSPTAQPNSRMIGMADRMLGRDGRLAAAVGNLPRAAPAPHGQPFRLRTDRPLPV